MTPRKGFTDLQRARIFEARYGLCHICDRKIQVGEKWDVEHIMPLSMNGTNDEANLAPAHVACHSTKSRKETTDRAKCDRIRAKHVAGHRSSNPMPGSRASKWKKPMNGPAVLR